MTTRDPVCGMFVDPATEAASRDYGGKTYSFCAPGCAEAFDKDPARYVKSRRKSRARASRRVSSVDAAEGGNAPSPSGIASRKQRRPQSTLPMFQGSPESEVAGPKSA